MNCQSDLPPSLHPALRSQAVTPLTEAADAPEGNHQDDCVFLESEDGELQLPGDRIRSGAEEVVNSMNCKYIINHYAFLCPHIFAERRRQVNNDLLRISIGKDGRADDYLSSKQPTVDRCWN